MGFHSERCNLNRRAANNNIALFDLLHEGLEHGFSVEAMVVTEAVLVEIGL